jgi:hypothetical protein
MNHNDIIDWKVSSLTAPTAENNDEMKSDMKHYIEQHPELQTELIFIESFWSNRFEDEIPSSQMDANFYQMLSKAQVVNHSSDINQQNSKQPIVEQLKRFFIPQSFAQFAMLGLVIVVGFNLNSAATFNESSSGLANLQHEVSSLNTMLAISLLDKSSASERLSGVAYSRSSDVTNPVLQGKLVELIQSDKSTSVRLAVLNRLQEMKSIEKYSEQLLLIINNESNVLVQISLCRLLLSNGSSETITQLKELLSTTNLSPEVREILQADSARSFT